MALLRLAAEGHDHRRHHHAERHDARRAGARAFFFEDVALHRRSSRGRRIRRGQPAPTQPCARQDPVPAHVVVLATGAGGCSTLCCRSAGRFASRKARTWSRNARSSARVVQVHGVSLLLSPASWQKSTTVPKIVPEIPCGSRCTRDVTKASPPGDGPATGPPPTGAVHGAESALAAAGDARVAQHTGDHQRNAEGSGTAADGRLPAGPQSWPEARAFARRDVTGRRRRRNVGGEVGATRLASASPSTRRSPVGGEDPGRVGVRRCRRALSRRPSR